MIYEVDTSKLMTIDWNVKGAARILQNVVNLLNTSRYEIAYARTIGINPDWIGRPAGKAAGIITNGIVELIAAREPRAKVKNVKYLGVSKTGDINIRVVVEI